MLPPVAAHRWGNHSVGDYTTGADRLRHLFCLDSEENNP